MPRAKSITNEGKGRHTSFIYLPVKLAVHPLKYTNDGDIATKFIESTK